MKRDFTVATHFASEGRCRCRGYSSTFEETTTCPQIIEWPHHACDFSVFCFQVLRRMNTSIDNQSAFFALNRSWQYVSSNNCLPSMCSAFSPGYVASSYASS